MASEQNYSFIDIAALDEVRTRFAAGEALALVTTGLDRIVWANGPGANFFGFDEIEAAIGASTGLSGAAKRQIGATRGFPDVGHDRPVAIRLGSRLLNLSLSGILLPDNQKALLVTLPATEASRRDETAARERAVSGFEQAGHFAALVDAAGDVTTASPAFDALGISDGALKALVEEVRDEPDRLVKRFLEGVPRRYPAGIARLTDDPALHLLIVVDEPGMPAAIGAMPEIRETAAGEAPADITPPDVTPAAAATEHRHASPQQAEAHHDVWYFRSTEDAPGQPAERQPGGDERASAAGGDEIRRFDSGPARFAWRTDAETRFTSLSAEFAEAVGSRAAAVIGRPFNEVAQEYGLDPDGEIAGLLQRRDTWSGRTVLWPVAGTDRKVPVDLAALPAYGRDRTFEGFRGFGIVRMSESRPDPDATGLRLVEEAEPRREPEVGEAETGTAATSSAGNDDDPFKGEVPALDPRAADTRDGEKVIRLSEHRSRARENGLSVNEQSAFREIAERLRQDSSERGKDARDESPAEHADTGGQAPAAMDPVGRHANEADQEPAEAAGIGEAASPGEQDSSIARESAPQDDAQPARPDTANAAQSHRTRGMGPAALPSAFSGGAFSPAGRGVDPAILEHLPVPLLVHSGDTLYFANADFLALTGYESVGALADAGGLGAIFADPYEEGAEVQASDARTVRIRSANGEEIPVEAHLQSIPWEGRKALFLALRRIVSPEPASAAAPETVDDRAEDLEIRLSQMRTIIDTATDGVVILDNEANIRSISRPAEALFGYETDDVAGSAFTSLFAIESQRAAKDYVDSLADNGVASVLNDGREVIGRESKGRFIPLFMTIGRLPQESGFCAVVRDITQWKRAEEELTQARMQAERSSSQKTEFLARVSHEIRTPLNAIIGFSELMLDEKFGPIGADRYRDYLRDINRSGNHVLDLVNDLLDITKIEAGEQEMHYEAISLNDTLAETVAMMQPQANRERVIIRSSFSSRLPDVVADLRSVRQIGLNLMANAIRYTQPGGQVIVSTSYEVNGAVTMRVRDTGVGMSTAEIDQALKPFKQLNTFKRGRGDGTGLGLPLTRAMVEANRARFTISSTPGEGTLVEITFPSTRVLAD